MDRAQWKILLSARALSADHCHFTPAARNRLHEASALGTAGCTPLPRPRAHTCLITRRGDGTSPCHCPRPEPPLLVRLLRSLNCD